MLAALLPRAASYLALMLAAACVSRDARNVRLMLFMLAISPLPWTH